MNTQPMTVAARNRGVAALASIPGILLIIRMTPLEKGYQPYGSTGNAPVSGGALMVTGCMVGNISSKLLLGVLCDTLGAVKGCLIMFTSVIVALVAFLAAPANSSWLYLVAAILFGAVFSLGGIGLSQMIRLVYGPEKFPSVYAFGSVFPYLGTAIMNTSFGYIYDFSGSYRGALALSLAMAISALLITIVISRSRPAQNR